MTEVSLPTSLTGPTLPSSKPTPQLPPPSIPSDETEGASSEIRCICGFEDDDGFTIQCDKCLRWQHSVCMRISQKDVPEVWQCHVCNPGRFQDADKKRAYEKQKKRREQEIRRQRKNGGGTSNKKKEAGSNSHHQRNDSDASHLPDKIADRKPSSPKDSTSAKSRRQRPANSGVNTTATGGNNANGSTPHSTAVNYNSNIDPNAGSNRNSPAVHSPGLEDEFDSDSEIPAAVYNREYNLITSNSILSPDTKSNLTQWARNIVPPELSITTDDFTRRFAPQHFKVRRVSGSERSPATANPQMYVTVDDACDASRFILEYRGEIGLQQNYKADTINQYHLIHHPKPFVLFPPRLPFCIDARRCGSEARFIRRSCKPNLELKALLVDGHDVRFCLYSRSQLDAGTELTIGWEWDPTTVLAQFASGDVRPESNSTESLKLTAQAGSILSQFGGCACTDKKACIFEKLTDQALPKNANKNSTRRKRPADISGTSSSITVKEPTPERLTNGHQEDSRKRRSSSLSSRGNSGSRDRTPSYPLYDAPPLSAGALEAESTREARKMKETISLIEKLNNHDGQQSRKRVKRPNSSKEASTGTDTADRMIIDDAHDDKKSSKSAVSLTLSSPTDVKSIQRTKPRANYVEASTQTEPLVFRCNTRTNLPPRKSASKKQSILAMFRRERMQIGLIKEESSKPSVLSEDVHMQDSVTDNSPNDVKKEVPNTAGADLAPEAAQPERMAIDLPLPNEAESSTIHVVDPALKSPPIAPDAATGEDTTPNRLVNGFRSPELHVQMPGVLMFPNAPTTPALVSAGVRPTGAVTHSPFTQSPPPLSSGLVHQAPDQAHQVSSATMATPVKKMLSLSEYNFKRRKAGEISDKLAPPTATNVPQSPSLPNSTSGSVAIPDVSIPSGGIMSNDTVMMDVDVKTESA